ncbi:MAG: DoxX family protein [Anaerolineae bacterium]|nr:DoxX family protein [Anaerolineae bacterium]
MNIILWIVQILLAVMFLMAGVMKAFQYERAKASLFWVKDVPRGLVTFIGICELLGGLGLVLPVLTGILPGLTLLAALGLALIMLFAIIFHVTRREPQAIVFNLVLLVLAGFVAYGRFTLVPLS